MSPKTILCALRRRVCAPPGARTPDTLIKRSGFQGAYSSDFWRFTRLTPCAIMSLLLTLSSRKEVRILELLVSFIISVIASVVGYYICKWLDGDE